MLDLQLPRPHFGSSTHPTTHGPLALRIHCSHGPSYEDSSQATPSDRSPLAIAWSSSLNAQGGNGRCPPHELNGPSAAEQENLPSLGGQIRKPGRAMSGVYGDYSPVSAGPQYGDYSQELQVQDTQLYNLATHTRNRLDSLHSVSSEAASGTASRLPSPVLFERPTGPQHKEKGASSSSRHAVASYLQLPIEISLGRPGSLAEFTAQITCLFWFESTTTLTSVEHAPHCPTPAAKLAHDAIPATGFLKWVTTILTTTQVSTSVVLLALLFVLRLKKRNPQVQGKAGSEYRLLTVALMLGNKFLDDNTYTNKTWAEVSGIDVKEIHVMEVEFLSHMKYDLYTSKEQWRGWYRLLNKFWTYHDLASRKIVELTPSPAPYRLPTLQIPWALPSPPASTTASPPYASAASPEEATTGRLSNLPPPVSANTISSAVSMPEHSYSSNSRKRSWDEVAQEPMPKRSHLQQAIRQRNPHAVSAYSNPRLETLPSLPSAPYPKLPMPKPQTRSSSSQEALTPQSLPSQVQGYSNSGRNTPSAQLPANWLQGLPQPSTAPHRPSNAMAYALSSHNGSAYGSRQQTPTSSFSNLNPFENLGQYSPSRYLNQRTSPYRPVRNMSQLTQAPPSRDMYEHPAQISNAQMQWQPLKKNVDDAERGSGPLPYYYNSWTGHPYAGIQPQYPPQPLIH